MPDGVFDEDGAFHAPEDLADEDVEHVLARTVRCVLWALQDELGDERNDDVDGTLAALDRASLTSQPTLFPHEPSNKRRCKHLEGFSLHVATTVLDALSKRTRASTYRVPWAELLRRTFGLDVLACPKCDGRRSVIAYIEEPSLVRKILRHLGLPAAPLPIKPTRMGG